MFDPVCYTIFQMAQYSGSIPRRGTVGARHAAAPTFIDDTAYRPSSVMAYAMPPSPRGRLSSEGSAHFCDIRPYTPSVALGDSSPYTPGAFFLSRQPLRRFFRSIIAAKRAGHAAAPTFIDDTAYRPSSVMAYAMPPSPRGRLSSEGSAHFCDIRPYTPSVTALP